MPISALFLPFDTGPSFCPGWGRFFWWPLGSAFRAQIVSMPESLPCGRDGVLDAHHICAFSGEDMNRPVRVKLSIELVSYLDIGHIFASGEAADFLKCYALHLMSSDERFGHRVGSPESIDLGG